jgi:TolB-like protein/DNA-binding SARP family transcriptional activator/Flp pilus assembly protein TadD
MFSLKLFGGFWLEAPEGPVRGRAVQSHRVALLSLLARCSAGITRDKVTGYLWPVAGADQARHLLSNSLYLLRRALGPDAVRNEGDTLQLDHQAVDADVVAFDLALAQRNLQTAVELYSGPFLDGFFLPGAPEFERWVEAERDRLGRKYAGALEALAETHEGASPSIAAEWWRRLAAHAPYDSRVALRTTRALAAAGDPAGAILHADSHVHLLREELELAPDGALLAFVASLRARQPEGSQGAVQTAPRQAPVVSRADTGEPGDEPVPAEHAPAPAAPAVPARGSRTALPSRGSPIRRNVGLGLFILLLGSAGLVYRGVQSAPAEAEAEAPARPRSLAILPIENCTPDPTLSNLPDGAQEYFADGLTDALIMEAARIPGLRVISRTSVMQFKNVCGTRQQQEGSLNDIARQLGVEAVLEGTVVRVGARIRVTAHLVDPATDAHLWASGLAYDWDLADVLTIQHDAARAIAEAIRMNLFPGTPVAPAPRVPPAAREAFLRGRYALLNEGSIHGFDRATRAFYHAIDLAPDYAEAHAALANAYLLCGATPDCPPDPDSRPSEELIRRGRAAAARALQLDSGLSEAHLALGRVLRNVDWDVAGAARHFERAVELNPNNADAYTALAQTYGILNRGDAALSSAVRARELDPLSMHADAVVILQHVNNGQYERAVSEARKALSRHEGWLTFWALGRAHTAQGEYDEALISLRRALELSGGLVQVKGPLAYAYAAAGLEAQAAEILTDLEETAEEQRGVAFWAAMANTGLGRHETAVRWLERAYEERTLNMLWLHVLPEFAPLRGHPRFEDLVSRLGVRAAVRSATVPGVGEPEQLEAQGGNHEAGEA